MECVNIERLTCHVTGMHAAKLTTEHLFIYIPTLCSHAKVPIFSNLYKLSPNIEYEAVRVTRQVSQYLPFY